MTDYNLNASTRDSLIVAGGVGQQYGEPAPISVLETRSGSTNSAKMASERQKLLDR